MAHAVGMCVPGRPVCYDFIEESPNVLAKNIDQNTLVTDICVFLNQPLSTDNIGLSVYYVSLNGGYQYIGYISNNKPSDILHISSIIATNQFKIVLMVESMDLILANKEVILKEGTEKQSQGYAYRVALNLYK
jgi:Protein of unknown function (DUF775)